MPDEPNTKMDELLRRYARQRREQAEFALHPAVRKSLQAEAARSRPARQPISLWTRLRVSWPQVAFGGGLAAVFVVVLVLLRPAPEKQKLPEPPAGEQALLKRAAPAAPPAASARAFTPDVVPEPVPLRDAAADSAVTAKTVSAGSGVAAEQLGRAAELKELGSALRLHFVQVRPEPRTPVLNSFQLEQSGNDLLIVDRDGSTYAGKLTLVTNSEARESERRSPVALGLAALSQNTAEYLFHAQGTNLTLAQPIVIEGQYFERTNSPPAPEQTFSYVETPASAPSSLAASPTPQYRRAIVGKATIAQTNQLPLRAVSVER